MKFLVLLLAIVVIVVAVVLIRRLLDAGSGRWELVERSDGELLNVYAVRGGKEELLVGSVPFAAEDFEYRIEELRSRGQGRLIALRGGSDRR